MQEIFRRGQSAGSSSRTSCRDTSPRQRSALAEFAWLGVLSCAVLLGSACQSARAGTLVTLNFTNPSLALGTVQIDLFNDLTPASVTNFLQYVNGSVYNDTIIHRVDTGLGVIQGGGFDPKGQSIATFAPIVDEYSRANTRGTISMARTSDPNSGTSQWFINTVDNTTSLGPANDGHGYAVFGWVVGGGMSVVDKIQAVPITNAGGAFNQLPTVNYTSGSLTPDNLIVLSTAVVTKTHPSFQNPVAGLDVNNDNSVTALDALVVINDLIANSTHAVANKFTGTGYLDVNGDGQVTPLDALQVINHFLNGGSLASSQLMTSSSAVPMAPTSLMATSLVVPEPASLVLAITAASMLGGFELRRRRRRAHRS